MFFFSIALLRLTSRLPDLLLAVLSVFSPAFEIVSLFLFLRGNVAYVSSALLSWPATLLSAREAVFFTQRVRDVDKDGIFILVSSDGVDAGVRAPRVLDAVLDLDESFLMTLPPRCARSLLISVVSADGNESGNTLVLVFAIEDEVGVDTELDAMLLLDRQPYVTVLRLLTGVLVTSATSEEFDSRALNFSFDRGRWSRSLFVP